jgi:hypothetical protein
MQSAFSVSTGGLLSSLIAWSIIVLLHLMSTVATLLFNLPYSAGTWRDWLRQFKQAFVKAAGETLHAHGSQGRPLAMHHSPAFSCCHAS